MNTSKTQINYCSGKSSCLLSLNISKIKNIQWRGKTITTGIFKEPTLKKLRVRGVNIEGDEQADRSVHGGVDKAIYAYPSEHYPFWKNQFPDKELTFGMFGENLTTKGLLETEVNIGDKFKIGTTELIAVQPRVPCYKLGIRFQEPEILKIFYNASFPGIYFKISKEGELEVGDEINLISTDPGNISIKTIYEIIKGEKNQEILKKAISLDHLPNLLKERFTHILSLTSMS